MNIAVIGSRGFQNEALLHRVLSNAFSEDDVLVSGGARGADRLAENWARRHGTKCRIFKADWNRYGRSAGYRRNYTLIAQAEKVIAFWDGQSRGTAHSLELARKKGIAVAIHRF